MKYVTLIYLCFLLGLEIVADHFIRPWDLVPFGDKIMHFLSAGILAFLLNASLKSRVTLGSIQVQTGSLLAILLGTLAEFSQLLMEARTFSSSDLLCSYFGIFFFGRFGLHVYQKRNEQLIPGTSCLF